MHGSSSLTRWDRGAPLLWAALISLTLGACSQARVVVTAETEALDPSTGEQVTQPISDLRVQILPFDRDAIFDSLAQVAPRPEPPVPDSVRALQDSVTAARESWLQAEARWAALRDSMKTLSDRLAGMNVGTPQYAQLYGIFGDIEAQVGQLERRMNSAFNRFTELTNQTTRLFDEIRAQKDAWADQAFADYDMVAEAKLRTLKLDVQTDTTDAMGQVTFVVKPGEWWVYARQQLPLEELYWNVPIEIVAKEPYEVRLTRANAEVRDMFGGS